MLRLLTGSLVVTAAAAADTRPWMNTADPCAHAHAHASPQLAVPTVSRWAQRRISSL